MMRIALAVMVVAALLAGCDDDVTHGNLDKWMNREGGPGKLRSALRSTSVDSDLAAHAAVNLLLIRMEKDVTAAFDEMGSARRSEVLGKLAPRLWEVARIDGEMTQPNADQIAAKDLLFTMREHTDGDLRREFDRYLIDWYTGGYYEARAGVGRYTGATVMRAIGPQAAPGMIDATNMVLAMPAPKPNQRVRIGDDLMLGLAVTGDVEAVKYLLDLTGKADLDPSLPDRAMDALHGAYVEPPSGLFEKAPPDALVTNIEALDRLATDPDSSNHIVNRALELIAAAGMPHCLAPLVAMIKAHPSSWWVGADNALRCGAVDAIDDVARALPTGQGYERELIEDNVIDRIAAMTPKEQVIPAVEPLLADDSWVARWVAVETIGRLGAPADAAKLDKVAKDRHKLRGYHGDDSVKDEPTLGQRAAELASALKSKTP